LPGRHLANYRKRLQVEDRHVVAAAVADEAAVQLGGDRNPVNARRIRNVANDLVRVDVHDDDMRGVGDVESARGAVDGEGVPAAFAAKFDRADDVIAGGGGRGERYRTQHADNRRNDSLHVLSSDVRPTIARRT